MFDTYYAAAKTAITLIEGANTDLDSHISTIDFSNLVQETDDIRKQLAVLKSAIEGMAHEHYSSAISAQELL
jgi:hypothetical protein